MPSSTTSIVLITGFSVLVFFFLFRSILNMTGRHYLDRTNNKFLWELIVKNASLLSILLLILILFFLLPQLKFFTSLGSVRGHILTLLTIALVSILAIRMTLGFSKAYLRRHNINVTDNLQARKVHTHVRVTEKIAIAAILIVAALAMALSFEEVRQFSSSILASAGVLGIILGFAAQKSLALFFAGIQIAITQPIRLDDAVFVDNEWGWIEEINLTYVIVRLWDRRRLILPINYFLEKPFQNWTRTSADLLGTVFVYVDYNVPVEVIRRQVQKIVNQTPLWNKEVCVVQVTEFMANNMQIRILATANNSPETFDLRCFIREKLLDFLVKKYPESLPRFRLESDLPEKSNRNQKK